MPYFHIHMIKGVRSPEEIRKLADVVQQCSLDHFNAPPRDRYQVCLFCCLVICRSVQRLPTLLSSMSVFVDSGSLRDRAVFVISSPFSICHGLF